MQRAEVRTVTVAESKHAQFLPFFLPDQAKGLITITSTVFGAGTLFPVVSLRNSIFMGIDAEEMKLKEPVRVHYMRDRHGICMSSIPQEVEQANRQLSRAHGKVIVGGLGLGMAPAILNANPAVHQVVVIELNQDVIDLVEPYLPKHKTVVLKGDIKRYLRKCKGWGMRHDFAFYDTWRGTSEWDHSHYVLPLRKVSQGIVPQSEIECWNEAEMLGQILAGLHGMIAFRHRKEGEEFARELPFSPYEARGARWAYLNYLFDENPSDADAVKALGRYMKALKDPILFQKDWGKYNKKPKRSKT